MTDTNKTEHTPGPWSYTASIPEDGSECFWIVGADGRDIGAVDGPQTDEREAYARLIAASPRLLEALRKAHELIASIGFPADTSGRYFKDGKWTFDEAVPDFTNAQAVEQAFECIGEAIAKATGAPA